MTEHAQAVRLVDRAKWPVHANYQGNTRIPPVAGGIEFAQRFTDIIWVDNKPTFWREHWLLGLENGYTYALAHPLFADRIDECNRRISA